MKTKRLLIVSIMIFLMVFNVLMDESKEKQLLSLNNNIKENMEKQLLGGEVREEFFTSSERVPNPEGTSFWISLRT